MPMVAEKRKAVSTRLCRGFSNLIALEEVAARKTPGRAGGCLRNHSLTLFAR
jgi:hypothetical protein